MGRRPEFAGGGLIRSFGGWDEEGKGTGAYAVPEVTLGEQSVDFAKIGISDNFCNGGHIGPELLKLTRQKTTWVSGLHGLLLKRVLQPEFQAN